MINENVQSLETNKFKAIIIELWNKITSKNIDLFILLVITLSFFLVGIIYI